MNRGCVAVSETKCDNCESIIEHGQQYLLIEDDKGNLEHFCTDCCLAKGYARYKTEKGERVVTFL